MGVIRKGLLEIVNKIPESCGVYLMKDKENQIIYIGKAKKLKQRVRSYFIKAQDVRQQSLKNTFLVSKIRGIDYLLTATNQEAFLLEANLIKKHHPRYNIRLKDDKSYPYICCSVNEKFPRFYMDRRVKQKGVKYFGPYTDLQFIKCIIRFLNQQFQIRDCKNAFMRARTSPCLTYQMGACTAPCVGRVSVMQYQRQVKKALGVLQKGIDDAFLLKMEQKMKSLAKKQRFEEAKRLRDSIKAIRFVQEKQSVVLDKPQDLDTVVFYRDDRGVLLHTLHIRAGVVVGHRFHFFNHLYMSDNFFEELCLSATAQYYMDNVIPQVVLLDFHKQKITKDKKDNISYLEAMLKERNKKVRVKIAKSKLEKNLVKMALRNAKERFEREFANAHSIKEGLRGIQKKFTLPKIPMRIECFDISHFQGDCVVGAKVVFEEGVPKKSDYKRYRIPNSLQDDCLSMQKMIQKNFSRKGHVPLPDLILVDGGKGQLNTVVKTLQSLNIFSLPVVAIAKPHENKKLKHQVSMRAKKKDTNDRFFIPGRKNPLMLKGRALNILTQLRDAAHLTAITYHRSLFRKKTFS